jgi:hypothetical protein
MRGSFNGLVAEQGHESFAVGVLLAIFYDTSCMIREIRAGAVAVP